MTDIELTEQPADIAKIEAVAVELAGVAAREIMSTFGTIFTVRYKSGQAEAPSLRDPVSEVDRRVELSIRACLNERFPDHGIIGEEFADRPNNGSEFVWVVDPIDGTTNFVNGFPLFAASIGVVRRGRPVVGAVWVSVSHALRPGIYHTRAQTGLRFEGEDVTPKVNAAVLRRLAGVPIVANADEAGWETRKTGSAALECALVAAGLLEVARFTAPNIWDVAAGLALIRSAGGVIYERNGDAWLPMDEFAETLRAQGNLRSWRRDLVVGREEAVRRMSLA